MYIATTFKVPYSCYEIDIQEIIIIDMQEIGFKWSQSWWGRDSTKMTVVAVVKLRSN